MAEAEAEMGEACGLDPQAVPPRIFLGRIYESSGKLAQAAKVYAELKRVAPDDPHAYRALGTLYSSTGQREKAIEEFRSVLAAKPGDDCGSARRWRKRSWI